MTETPLAAPLPSQTEMNPVLQPNMPIMAKVTPPKKKMWPKVLLAVVLLVIATVIGIGIYAYTTYNRVFVTATNKTPEPTPVVVEEGFNGNQPFSVLLLGYGGGGHQGGLLTDSIILTYIVPKQERIYLISVPRDLWVSLPINGDQMSNWKINAAYAIGSDDRGYPRKPALYTGEAGGGELAKYAIEQVTGIRPNHFVALSFAGFRKSIDVLNGVTVNVEKSFDDFQYPIEGMEDDPCGKTEEDIAALSATLSATLLEKEFPCRYEQLHFDKGLTKMDGTTALKFVRSRHSAQSGGDFERSRRQRALILGVKERVLSLDFFPKIIPFISSLTQDLKTDVSIDKMEMGLKYKDDLSSYKIISIALSNDNVLKLGTSSNGQSIVMPKTGEGDWQYVREWLKAEMAKTDEELASPSASPSLKPKTATQSSQLQ